MTGTKKITKDSIIGTVMKEHPATKEVIQKYFGNGCFTCPGMNVETLSFGAMMHNIDPKVVVEELNNVIEGEE